ncbi:uncharacterized protein VP01_459g8 [Puccinia sorghi]|uniref:Retrotransposon gag domain-containing protein n=1 Tax=Puccinia sorghi TaxID=27349 RepID=A0A0L6UNJ1_9BASI|nr:uncharacterized protein VP01_459g8 [Puccinia sorghi]
MILAKPQPFNGTCGAAAKYFVGQILLHNVDQFPTNSSKVAFAVSFMREYAATWSQPYLMKVFNTEEVAFEKFLDDFKSSFFEHNCQHRAEVALQSLRQTGTVTAYTQEFNSHSRTVGWANTPLMSLYQHGLKENIQLTVVRSNIQFKSLLSMQAMALKEGQKIEGIWNGQPAPIPPTSSSSPTTNTNAMDLLAFQHVTHN